MKKNKKDYRYTAYFCEENIWFLGKSLLEENLSSANMKVFFLTNSNRTIPLKNQICVPQGETVIWDYHVILSYYDQENHWIFDFDSYLSFPCQAKTYIYNTFYDNQLLLSRYHVYIRVVEMSEYLDSFYSDRSHMIDDNNIPFHPFPDWFPIMPSKNSKTLESYLNMDNTGNKTILTYEKFVKKYGN